MTRGRRERRRARARRSADRQLEQLTSAVNLLVKLAVLAFVLHALTINEIYELVDVDVGAGSALPIFWQHTVEHGQAAAALLVVVAGVTLSVRQIVANFRYIKPPAETGKETPE